MRLETRTDPTTGDVTTFDVDLTTGEAVEQVNGVTTATGAYDPTLLEGLRAQEREQKQLDRLQTKFDEVKAAPRLTVADYRQDAGPVDMREAVRMINDLRSMVLDLTRIVRGLAAEEGDN